MNVSRGRKKTGCFLFSSPSCPAKCASVGNLLIPAGAEGTGLVIARVPRREFLRADMNSCPRHLSFHPSLGEITPAGMARSCVSSISRSIRLSVNSSPSVSGQGRSNVPAPPGGARGDPSPNPPQKSPSNIHRKREKRGRKDETWGKEGRMEILMETLDEKDGKNWRR